MKITGLISSSFFFIVFTANAQLKEGKANIEKLCGCFNVDYQYAETFSPDSSYKFHDREHQQGIELVLSVISSDRKIVLQHLLVFHDSMIIKHWREDWTYECASLLQYDGNKQWTKLPLSKTAVKDKWAQTVWEVDDAPRYQGISRWVETDGKTFWQNTTNAPLPRREYTKRADYNILKRGNRIIVSDKAWWHEQDNQKINKTGNAEKLIAEEKGMNYYTRISDSKCEKAKTWWKTNGEFWNIVRLEWESFLNDHDTIILKPKVDDKRLDEYFTALWEQWNRQDITAGAISQKVKVLIRQFAGNPQPAVAARQ